MKFVAAPMSISIDTSFLAHAIVPSQQSVAAITAFRTLLGSSEVIYGAPGVFVEFPSLLRKLSARSVLRADEADELFQDFLDFGIVPRTPTLELQRRAWQLARHLDQSDTFDAMGYAVAEDIDGE